MMIIGCDLHTRYQQIAMVVRLVPNDVPPNTFYLNPTVRRFKRIRL